MYLCIFGYIRIYSNIFLFNVRIYSNIFQNFPTLVFLNKKKILRKNNFFSSYKNNGQKNYQKISIYQFIITRLYYINSYKKSPLLYLQISDSIRRKSSKFSISNLHYFAQNLTFSSLNFKLDMSKYAQKLQE